MKISLPKEIKDGEFRVAIIPSNVARLVDAGHTVYVEKDAGAAAGYPDTPDGLPVREPLKRTGNEVTMIL